MKAVAIIPARFHSTRFPGKPLSDLGGKPLIQFAYENACESNLFSRTVVATDDQRIADAVKVFGGESVMTSDGHVSGTDRCAEALKIIGGDYDVVVNLQGDEPFVGKEILINLLALFEDDRTQIGTLAQKITSLSELTDAKNAKIVLNARQEALYFSRAAIPFQRGVEMEHWLDNADYWNHVGLYAYRPDVLEKIVQLKTGRLEMLESLEQLRWLENGYTIRVAETIQTFLGVDTPDDLRAANEWLKQKTKSTI